MDGARQIHVAFSTSSSIPHIALNFPSLCIFFPSFPASCFPHPLLLLLVPFSYSSFLGTPQASQIFLFPLYASLSSTTLLYMGSPMEIFLFRLLTSYSSSSLLPSPPHLFLSLLLLPFLSLPPSPFSRRSHKRMRLIHRRNRRKSPP